MVATSSFDFAKSASFKWQMSSKAGTHLVIVKRRGAARAFSCRAASASELCYSC